MADRMMIIFAADAVSMAAMTTNPSAIGHKAMKTTSLRTESSGSTKPDGPKSTWADSIGCWESKRANYCKTRTSSEKNGITAKTYNVKDLSNQQKK